MKRLFTIIVIIFIICSSIMSALADSADFSVQSAEAEPDRIVSVDFNCKYSGSLAAAVFEFGFDSSALGFRGCDSPDGIKLKSDETDNNVRVVYYNQAKTAAPGGNIFKLKFKTLKEGSHDISFKVSGCVDHTPNDIAVGNCTGGSINVSKNTADNDNAASSKASNQSSGKEKNSNSKSKSSSKGSSRDNSEADDEAELEENGELNDIEEKQGGNAVILYILIGVGVLILMFTGIKLGMIISAKKNDKTNNN